MSIISESILSSGNTEETRHLKESYNRIIDALHEIAVPEDLNFGADRESATRGIIDSTITRIKRLLPLDGHAVLLLNDDMEFVPHYWSLPPQERALNELLQHWIDDGIFSWAINQNRAVVIHGNERHDTVLLHVIAAHSRVMGMFIGFSATTAEMDEAILALLSVVLLNCSNNLEACELQQQLREQNESLEQQVRQRTRQLELARQRAEESVRTKSLFLATMSHEIRTPMNGVIGMAQLLAGTKLDSQQRHYTNTILQSGRALTALINDILDYSKIEAGRLELENHPFDLKELARSVIELLSFQIEKRPIEISFVQSSKTPLNVIGDPARLRQILINLMGNAIKFTERGTITLEIDASPVPNRHHLKLHISISDNGIGIAPEVLPTLFTPFNQADRSTYRIHGGTGLGLAICKQLVEQMNGTIGVVSTPNEGSTFWFDLILPQAQAEEVEHYANSTQAPSNHEIAPLATQAQGRPKSRILVAEDNPINQEVISHMLDALGCKVQLAENGQEALNFLTRSNYDLVLMDYQMPVLNGCDATQQIRNTAGRNQRIPIIALTASTLPEEVQRYRDAGMDDFLAKPVEHSALARMLDKWLDMKTTEQTETDTSTASAPTRQRPLLDAKAVTNLVQLMGDGFVALKQTFLNNTRDKIEQLQEAVSNNDMEKSKLLAHSLKGSCGTIGASEMAIMAKKIEDQLSNSTPMTLLQLTLELEQLFKETGSALEQYPTRE